MWTSLVSIYIYLSGIRRCHATIISKRTVIIFVSVYLVPVASCISARIVCSVMTRGLCMDKITICYVCLSWRSTVIITYIMAIWRNGRKSSTISWTNRIRTCIPACAIILAMTGRGTGSTWMYLSYWKPYGVTTRISCDITMCWLPLRWGLRYCLTTAVGIGGAMKCCLVCIRTGTWRTICTETIYIALVKFWSMESKTFARLKYVPLTCINFMCITRAMRWCFLRIVQ
jgi:hypothetical protein